MDAIELQELILNIVKAKQAISADAIVAEVRKNFDVQSDEIRAAIFPLVSTGEIAFDRHNRPMLISVE